VLRPPANIRISLLRARSIALAFFVLVAGCSSLPDRVAFAPTPGPPECGSKPGQFAKPEWDTFHADVAQLAKALQIEDTEPGLVFEHLRLAVRTLIDREGCLVNYSDSDATKPTEYALKCGTLSPDVERFRANLEKAVVGYLAAAGKAAKAYQSAGCFSPMTTQWLVPAIAAEGQAFNVNSGAMAGAPQLGGCNALDRNSEVCQRGCDNGNVDACAMIVQGEDVAAAHKAKTRECELRLKMKDDQKAPFVCSSVIDDEMKPGGSREKAQKLLTMMCEVDQGIMCTKNALVPTDPLFDKDRAVAIAKALDACQGPACRKEPLLNVKMPFYDAGRAHRVMEWMGTTCDAGDARCSGFAPYVMGAKTPFDRAIGEKVLHAAEAGCKLDSPPGDRLPCLSLISLYQWGPFSNPKKSGVLAEQLCAAPEGPSCVYLSICYKMGNCGFPKNLVKAREAFSRECDFLMKATPTPTRASVVQCGWADGTRPAP
jgi:hypothetical protein